MKHTTAILLTLLAATSIHADTKSTHQAMNHAPIGVMGDHTHHAGEWMLSYRYMNMTMDGLRRGNNDLSTAQALQDFMMVPVDMDMEMHMVGVMYAPSDRVTLMAMFNHLNNDMLMQNRMGNRFRTQSKGMGDTAISALVSLRQWGNNQVHANLGFTIPTGSINPRDTTPMGPNTLLPYPMRLGSGTYDLKLGVTWNQYQEDYSLGAQLMSTLRTGDNDQNYRLGHENQISFWAAKSLTDSWSVSGRLLAKNRQSIKGNDPRLMMMANMTPTANANFSGGDWAELSVGINYVSNAHNWSNGHRLALEYGHPLVQDLAGIQMKASGMLTLGWQKAF